MDDWKLEWIAMEIDRAEKAIALLGYSTNYDQCVSQILQTCVTQIKMTLEKEEPVRPKPDVIEAYQAGIRAEQDRRRKYWNDNLSDYTEEQWRSANPGYPKEKT